LPMFDTVARAGTALFSAYIVYVAGRGGISGWRGDDGMTLFAWHPICMVLSFGIISIEAVRAIQRRRSASSNVQIHSGLNDVAIVLALIGFFAIYSRKDDLEKPHFTSWHSLAGLVALGGFLLNAAHGLLRTARVIGGTPGKTGLQWIWVSLFHRVVGSLSHVVAAVALVSGLYSGWGMSTLGPPVATVLSLLVVVGEVAILSKMAKMSVA